MGSSHIEGLRSAIGRGGISSPDRIKPPLLRLLAEMQSRAQNGASADFFVQATRTVSSIRGNVLASERFECLRVAMGVLSLSGLHQDAIEAAEAALKIAASGELARQRVAHTFAGVIRADAGDVPRAVQHYEIALKICNELDDFASQVPVLNNLGIALNYAGLYREAVPILQSAVEAMERRQAYCEHRPSVLSNLAQSHFALGSLIAARDAISAAIQDSSAEVSMVNSYNMTVRYWTLSRIALAHGDREGARAAVEVCKSHAAANQGARTAKIALIAEASFKARYGETSQAVSMLENIINSSVHSEKTDAYPVLIAAYDECGKPDLALDTLRKYLGELREIRRSTLDVLLKNAGTAVPKLTPEDGLDLRQLLFEENRLRASVAERELLLSQIETLERLAISADLREEASGAHGFRVGTLTRLICEQLQYSKIECYVAELAARLHDLGKISLPDRIMLSPEALAEAERQFVSAHTRIGAELLSNSRSPELQLARSVALNHHEWWNGEGYPSKLSGTRIPIHARIVALADVFDALTHGRPYAPAWPVDKALAEIRSRRGTQFDPELTDVFLNLMERLINEHEDLDAYLGRASRHSPFLQARNKIRQMLETERENEKRATVDGNQTRH